MVVEERAAVRRLAGWLGWPANKKVPETICTRFANRGNATTVGMLLHPLSNILKTEFWTLVYCVFPSFRLLRTAFPPSLSLAFLRVSLVASPWCLSLSMDMVHSGPRPFGLGHGGRQVPKAVCRKSGAQTSPQTMRQEGDRARE